MSSVHPAQKHTVSLQQKWDALRGKSKGEKRGGRIKHQLLQFGSAAQLQNPAQGTELCAGWWD